MFFFLFFFLLTLFFRRPCVCLQSYGSGTVFEYAISSQTFPIHIQCFGSSLPLTEAPLFLSSFYPGSALLQSLPNCSIPCRLQHTIRRTLKPLATLSTTLTSLIDLFPPACVEIKRRRSRSIAHGPASTWNVDLCLG